MDTSKTQKRKDMTFHEGHRYKFAKRNADESMTVSRGGVCKLIVVAV